MRDMLDSNEYIVDDDISKKLTPEHFDNAMEAALNDAKESTQECIYGLEECASGFEYADRNLRSETEQWSDFKWRDDNVIKKQTERYRILEICGKETRAFIENVRQKVSIIIGQENKK